jgi:hypothetical protein
MNINDIVLRDMMDEEARQRREEARKCASGIRGGRRLVRAAEVALGVLVVALLAFLAWCCVSDAPHRFPARVQISR